jgi:hypothetical protein
LEERTAPTAGFGESVAAGARAALEGSFAGVVGSAGSSFQIVQLNRTARVKSNPTPVRERANPNALPKTGFHLERPDILSAARRTRRCSSLARCRLPALKFRLER